jgi:hypothetical protein
VQIWLIGLVLLVVLICGALKVIDKYREEDDEEDFWEGE